jgi:hypothetical protein
MADDINLEKVQKEVDDLQKTLKGMRKGLDSTTESLFKYTKSSKEHRYISDRLIQMKKQELRELGLKAGKDSTIYKTKSREIVQEIGDIRRRGKEFGAFSQAVGVGKTAMVGFTRSLKANVVLGLVNLAKGIFNTGARFIDAEERIKNFSDVVKDFGDVPFLGKGLSALAKSADFNVGIFKQLAQTGATFESSIINLRNAAHDANMPILDFVDMIQNNSQVMAQLFGTVDTGVRRMSQFQKELRRVTQDEFAQFGLNLQETTEYFQTYLMMERARGRFELGTAEQEIEQAGRYIKNLQILTKLTGEDIDSLNKRNRELAANSVLQSQLLKLGPAQRDAINNSITAFGGADTQIGKLITQVVAFGQATETDTALLNQLAGGQIIPAIEALKSGAIGVAEFRNIIGTAAQRGFLDPFTAQLARAEIASGQFGGVVNETGRIMKAAGLNIEEEMKARKTTTSGLVGLGDTLDVVKTKAELITTATAEGLANTFEYLSEAVGKIGEDPQSKALLKSGNITAGVLTSVFSLGSKALRTTSEGAPEEGIFARLGRYFSAKDSGSTAGGLEAETYGFASGTLGATGSLFKDFGSGTRAILHGREAVVPKASPMGSVLSMLDQLSVRPGTPSAPVTSSANTQTNTEFMRMNSILSENLRGLAEVMVKSEKHLNTLVGISAKTERNTENSTRRLANLSGSLV